MRATQATVRLNALLHNLDVASRLAPGAKNVAVVKANAYGHGAVEVARALEPQVPALAVAVMDEAVRLRDAGVAGPILVLQGVSSIDDAQEAAARGLWLMLHDSEQIARVVRSRLSRPLAAWLKVDTGMHRLGVEAGAAPAACETLARSDNVQGPVVLCTHLASADETDNPMTSRQVARFREVAAPLGLPTSIANSAGIMYWPESHADWNRPGYMLYGNPPSGSAEEQSALRPVMTLSSELMAVRRIAAGEGVGYGQRWTADRPSRIGTVSVGYGDGYPRHAPSGTPVLVGGRRVPLVGTVSMDMLTVDLSGHDDLGPGAPVELWGEALSVNEVAACAGTIGYELLAGLAGRVPLRYVS